VLFIGRHVKKGEGRGYKMSTLISAARVFLEADIKRFLGIIEHAWKFPGDEVCCHTHEINLIYKLRMTDLKFGDKVPQKESHVAFNWVPMDSLQGIDLRPLPLKQALSEWLGSADNHILWSTMK
jgi:hypothetical protein